MMKGGTCRCCLLAAVASLVAMDWPQTAAGQQFRVENRVFVEDQEGPQVESTTLFAEGKVYDFLKAPAEVTIFDEARGRFVLLDLNRRVRADLSTEQVASLCQRLRDSARTQSDPFLRFLADPSFDERFDDQTGELTLSSPWATYRLNTAPAESETVSRRYREFCDWYCQLNTMLNPGSRLPFARIMVNAALASRRLLPCEVTVTLRPKRALWAKRITVRSEHQVLVRLTAADRDRIAQVDQFMAIFTPIGFEQYQARIAN